MPIDWNNVLTTITPSAIPIITTLLGFLGGYLTHSLKIKGDNINVKRDRLLKNISKVEDYLTFLLEFSWLNADMEKAIAFQDSTRLNIETHNKELAALKEDLARIKNEILNATNHTILVALDKELEKLELHLVEAERKSNYYSQKVSDIEHEKDRIKSLETEYKQRLVKDDIGSTLNIIDPKDQIRGYINELQDISWDSKRNFYHDARVLELKGKISRFFDDQIKKIG